MTKDNMLSKKLINLRLKHRKNLIKNINPKLSLFIKLKIYLKLFKLSTSLNQSLIIILLQII
jgi:hypothetical protein